MNKVVEQALVEIPAALVVVGAYFGMKYGANVGEPLLVTLFGLIGLWAVLELVMIHVSCRE